MLADKLRSASAAASPLEFVGGAAVSSASATSTPSFSLSSLTGGLGSSPQAGDVVIACVSFKTTSARNITCTTAGYQRSAINYRDVTDDVNIAVFYKYLSSSETSVAFNIVDAVSSRFCVHVWRNADPYRPICIAGATTNTTAVPNAPSVTTPKNSNVVIAIGANAGASTRTLTNLTAPSGMSNFFQVTASSDSGIGIASILRETAGAYDPPAFGGGNSSTSSSAAAVSLCLWNDQGIRTPEFVAASSTNPVTTSSITVNKPAGTQQGDLMIAVMSASVNATFTGATGWTEVVDQAVSPSLRVAYRYAGATEGSSYSFTSSPSGASKAAAILTYRYAQYAKSALEAVADTSVTTYGFVEQPIAGDRPWTISLFFSGRAVASADIRNIPQSPPTPVTLTNRVQVSTASAPSIYAGETIATLPTQTITTTTNTTATLAADSSTSTPWAAVSISIKPA